MKKWLALFLILALSLAVLPLATAAEGTPLNFVAVDDTLPQELINSVVYLGSAAYVPSGLLKNYNLGINYSYFTDSTTACLESADSLLFFNVSTGRTFDGDDYYYSASAFTRGGTVYLPLSFICGFFGTFRYANLSGGEYGSVLRIYTGNSILTDEEFLRAARSVMRRRYEEYNLTAPVTPAESPEPEKTTRAGDTVYLGLIGLPESETPELLEQTGMGACFFLTGEEIRSDPDLVRELACRGYGLGVNCETGSEAEYAETAQLLWEAARLRSILTLLPADAPPISGAVCRFRSTKEAEADDRMAETYAVTAALEAGSGDETLLFPCGANHSTALNVLIYFLRDQEFTVKALRETSKP